MWFLIISFKLSWLDRVGGIVWIDLFEPYQVLCIDEATANIDLNTDYLIQQTIQEEFYDKTVLTIAHRLNTVMHSDRILVLSSGKVVEFAEPAYLLQKTDSLFHGFVHNHIWIMQC